MWNNLPYDIRENTNVCSSREESRRGAVLPVVLASCSILFIFFYPQILLQWRGGGREGRVQGSRDRLSALSFTCCLTEQNKSANATDCPPSLCCQRAREAGSPVWASCLGSSFSWHSEEVRNKPLGMLASLPHATAPNYIVL